MTYVDTIHFRVIKTTDATGAPAYVVRTCAASDYTGLTLTPAYPTPDEAIRFFEHRLVQALGTLTAL